MSRIAFVHKLIAGINTAADTRYRKKEREHLCTYTVHMYEYLLILMCNAQNASRHVRLGSFRMCACIVRQ